MVALTVGSSVPIGYFRLKFSSTPTLESDFLTLITHPLSSTIIGSHILCASPLTPWTGDGPLIHHAHNQWEVVFTHIVEYKHRHAQPWIPDTSAFGLYLGPLLPVAHPPPFLIPCFPPSWALVPHVCRHYHVLHCMSVDNHYFMKVPPFPIV